MIKGAAIHPTSMFATCNCNKGNMNAWISIVLVEAMTDDSCSKTSSKEGDTDQCSNARQARKAARMRM